VGSIIALRFRTLMAYVGQTLTQDVHPVQLSPKIWIA